MPHSLTNRQREYLVFLRQYISQNESSPRLTEIADHFRVKNPTAHKTLKALQKKGYLFFGRDSLSGFFIRLIERAGSAEVVTEIVIAGKISKYGEVYDFPEKHGHFASLLVGANPEELFGLVAFEDIPQANISLGDLIIFDYGKKPQPNDICLISIGEKLLLARVVSKTYDQEILSDVVASEYPIPDGLTENEREQFLNWYPIALDEENLDHLKSIFEEEKLVIRELPPELVLATALRLSRQLAF